MPNSTEPVLIPQYLLYLLPLISAIIGGVIATVGNLGATILMHILQTNRDRKTIARAKLETLLGHLFEIHPWEGRFRRHFLAGEGEREPSPAANIVAVTAMYFPTLRPLASDLDVELGNYELAVLEIGKKMTEAASAASSAVADKAQAEKTVSEHTVGYMEIAAKKARLKVLEDFSPISDAYKRVVAARRSMIDAARALALTL